MKKLISLFLTCFMLAGCMANYPEPTETDPVPVTAATEEPTQVEPVTTERAEPSEAPPVLTYSIYLPNGNADGFDVETAETSQITADGVLAELQTRGVLPDTVLINAFGAQGEQLIIDFNQSFADLICSMGTSGERLTVGSVVNTFLSAFQANSVYFTVDGEVLESGHTVYDFPIEFME